MDLQYTRNGNFTFTTVKYRTIESNENLKLDEVRKEINNGIKSALFDCNKCECLRRIHDYDSALEDSAGGQIITCPKCGVTDFVVSHS